MSITVRQITDEDKTSWHDLYLAYLKFYESEPTASATELLWDRVTKHNPDI
jgi:hypothetical protein